MSLVSKCPSHHALHLQHGRQKLHFIALHLRHWTPVPLIARLSAAEPHTPAPWAPSTTPPLRLHLWWIGGAYRAVPCSRYFITSPSKGHVWLAGGLLMRLPGEPISHICHIEYGEMSIAPGIRSPRLISAIKESTPPPLIIFIVLFHSVLFLRPFIALIF